MSIGRYREYRDSNLEWLGEVPRHWRLSRLRFVAQLNPSKSEIAELPREKEVSFLPMEDIGDDGVLNLERTRPIGQVTTGYTYFREGDVTLAKITPCFENGKGAVMTGLIEGIGFGTTELIVVRPLSTEAISKYLYWLFMSPPFRRLGEASMYGAGGQKRVPDEFVRNFTTAFPPLDEQLAIAKFLDNETAKIDELVVKQKELIDLLIEKRQALISHAVTKGLDSTVPMKDSSIEWLGEMPEHWESIKMSQLAESIQTGPFGSQLHSADYIENGIPVINPAHIANGDIVPDLTCTVSDVTKNRLVMHELLLGDIVFARRGELGRCALVTETSSGFLCGTGCFRVRPNKQMVYPNYLVLVCSTSGIRDWFMLRSVGSTMLNLNTTILGGTPLTLPPLAEQIAIVDFIIGETKKIDSLLTEAQRAIDLLKERRAALISAAVTGKIDVRGLVEAEVTA